MALGTISITNAKVGLILSLSVDALFRRKDLLVLNAEQAHLQVVVCIDMRT